MKTVMLDKNEYLNRKIKLFYSLNYRGYQKAGNPDFINYLKNTYDASPKELVFNAAENLRQVLSRDIPKVLTEVKARPLTVCVVPRAKALETYTKMQLQFLHTIKKYIASNPALRDGTSFIKRHTNTRTTHLRRDTKNYFNDGPDPYPGITRDTCYLSNRIRGSNILLIDDVYTKNVGVDEDVIQTLFDEGAKSVFFYAIAKTI